MKTKACVLESGDHAGDIYEYVMLAVARFPDPKNFDF